MSAHTGHAVLGRPNLTHGTGLPRNTRHGAFGTRPSGFLSRSNPGGAILGGGFALPERDARPRPKPVRNERTAPRFDYLSETPATRYALDSCGRLRG